MPSKPGSVRVSEIVTVEWELIIKEIKTEIIINTKPEKVWEVLTDFENYPTWNPFIQNISGEQKVG